MKKFVLIFLTTIFVIIFNSLSGQYCVPVYTNGCELGQGLTQFDLNTISQAIPCSGIPNYYQDYTAISSDLAQSGYYNIAVQSSNAGLYITVWIDYDQNSVFNPGEIVQQFTCTASGTTYIYPFTVPNTATIGSTRLRIMSSTSAYPSNPCSDPGPGNSCDFTMNITAPVTPPTVVTQAASGLTATTAVLNGSVNAQNSLTNTEFHYGLTTSYGTIIAGVPPTATGNSAIAVTGVVSGLVPNTTYHYKIVGYGAGGYISGGDATFTTSPLSPPVVVTGSATNITGVSATLNGTVNANGAPSTVYFEYGATVSYGRTAIGNPSGVSSNSPEPITADLTSLDLNTTYHYRIVSTNAAGTSYGSDMTFTTTLHQYCTPVYTYGCDDPYGYHMGITYFGLNTIDQTIPCTGTPSYYQDFTAVSTDLALDVTYSITVTVGSTSYGIYSSVWIDYNHDNVFDPNTETAGNGYCAPASTATFNLYVSASALTGTTGLRIMTNYGSYALDPCSTSLTWGNTADFSVNILSSASAPTVTTTAASGMAGSGATLNGTVNPNSFSAASFFDYGTTTSYGTTLKATPYIVSGSSPSSVSGAISGLLPNTLYHFRARAQNAGGITNGSDLTFTSAIILPVPTTTAATGIGGTSATVNGTVNPNNASTSVSFEYGLTTGYGSTITATPATIASGYTAQSVSAVITGLALNHTYHYRVVSTNAAGTSYGTDMTFTTLPTQYCLPVYTYGCDDPYGYHMGITYFGLNTIDQTIPCTGTPSYYHDYTAVSTDLALGVTYSVTVTVGSTSYGIYSSVWIDYNHDNIFDPATETAGSGYCAAASTASFSITVSPSALTGTTWFRVMTNYGNYPTDPCSTSLTWGNTVDFSTNILSVATPATVTTAAASSIAGSGATLNGTVNPNSFSAASFFDYGTTTSYGTTLKANPYIVSGSSPSSVSGAISGLLPNTLYHFRARAQNAGGITNGSDLTFTSAIILPVPTTTAATGIGGTSATVNGTVNPNNASTSVSFEYGLTTGYGSTITATPATIASGYTAQSVSAVITGLALNHTYHYRVVSTNAAGTSYGTDMTFTTLPTQYCLPVYTYGCDDPYGYHMGITYFGLNTIDQTIPCTGTPSYYHDYTAVSTDLALGVTYSVTVTVGSTSYGIYSSVWIDYNHDNIFDPATETAGSGYCAAASTASFSITISPSALTGTTGFRVMTNYGSYATDPCSTSLTWGNTVDFSTNILSVATPATVMTAAASSIAGSGATLNGTVNPNSFSAASFFDYGTTTSYGTTLKANPYIVSGSSPSSVSGVISDLLPNTLYHFRARAQNAGGITNGSDLTFTSAAIPAIVTTTAATSLGGTSATLNGTVNPNNSSSSVSFEYGLTTGYGSTVTGTPSTIASGYTAQPSSALVTGLALNQTYHYRIVSTNVAGTTYGNDMTFTTLNTVYCIPSYTYGCDDPYGYHMGITYFGLNTISQTIPCTGTPSYYHDYSASSTNLAQNGTYSVTVSVGSVSYGIYVTIWIDYDHNDVLDPATENAGSGYCGASSTASFNITISGSALTGSTRMRVMTNYGSYPTDPCSTSLTWGNTVDFSAFIVPAAPPSVSTAPATSIKVSTATVNGVVNAGGFSTTVSFEYGLTTAYGSTKAATPSPVTGGITTPVSAALTGLVPNSTYHYRVKGVSSQGTSYGSDMTFVTLSSTTTQTNTAPINLGALDQQILGIEIYNLNASNPVEATSFSFNTNGCTSTADLAGAKVFYTGTSNTFATTNQFGSEVTSFSPFTITGTQALATGTNYFWLAYSIKGTATPLNFVDAECTSITVGTAMTPAVTAPAGNRQIIDDKFLQSITVTQASTVSVIKGSSNNEILRLDFSITGTTGTMPLNSIVVTNTGSDADIAASGVKLYRTSTPVFATTNLLGTAQSFSSLTATFSSLAYELPTGHTYIWICYDISTGATGFHMADGKMTPNSINVKGILYPASEQNPSGGRLITVTPKTLPLTESAWLTIPPLDWNKAGTTWSSSTSNNAGGTPNELRANYAGCLDGDKMISPPLNTTGLPYLVLRFKSFLSNFGAGCTLRVQSSSDGINWTNEAWSLQPASGGTYGPYNVLTTINSNLAGGVTYVAFALTGNPNQINDWFIDNVRISGPEPPTVTTNAASSITGNSAVSGGNVIDDATNPVTVRGVCWGTSPNPTTSDPHTTDGSGLGVFISNITGLNIGTTYHVRAYATNGIGTGYGSDLPFTTLGANVFNVTGGGSYCTGGTGLTVGLDGSQSGTNYQLLKDGVASGSLVPGTGSPLSWNNNTDGTYTVEAGTTLMTGSAVITSYNNPVSVSIAASATTICAGTSVTFTASPTNGGTTPSYQWQVNNINAGSNNYQYTYQPAGGDQVKCIMTSNIDCPTGNPATSNTIMITVATPTPNLYGSESECAGATGIVYSTDAGAGISNYIWNVSAGGTVTAGGSSSSSTVTVTWNTAGPQTVSVNYSNSSGCSASSPTVKNVTVKPSPSPTITGPATACQNSTGNVYTTEAGYSNYLWTVSSGGTVTSGGTATDNTVTVTWTGSGVKTVSVNYMAANGCYAGAATVKNVTVYGLPVPVITGNSSTCGIPSAGNVYSTTSAMTNYAWTVSAGGTITSGGGTGDNTVTVTWNTIGTQTVTVSYTDNNGCTPASPSSKTVTVYDRPVPVISGPALICGVPSSGNVYSTSSGMTNYAWTVSAGGTVTSGGGSTNSSVTVTWNSTGTHTVTVTFTDTHGCTPTTPASKTINAYDLPVPNISGPTPICGVPSAGNHYTTEVGKTGYSWSVSAGGSITTGSTTNDITVTWSTAGTKTVTVSYTDVNGCTPSTPASKTVNVYSAPVPTITGPASVCNVPSAGNHYVTEPSMTNYTWIVSAGGTITGGSGSNDITVTWNNTGAQTVSVTYTDGNGCIPVTPTVKNVAVGTTPGVIITGNNAICQGELVQFTAAVTDGGSNPAYQWFVNGSPATVSYCGAPASGLIAWYPFSGNANDASGNGNNGTVTGATLANDRFGNANSAYSFNGSGNHIQIPVNINYSALPQLTMVAWVKPANISPIKTIISHDNSGYDREMDIDNRAGSGYCAFKGNGVLGSFPATAGTWDMITTEYDQSTNFVKLYKNTTSMTGTSAFNTGWTYTWIGGNPSYGEYWNGIIDEVRLYNRLLTDTEVTNLYNNSTQNNIFCYYPNNGDNVTCQVTTEAGCTATSNTITMSVATAPTPTISGPASVCEGTTGNVYTTEALQSNYAWSVSVGGTITAGGGTTDNTVTVTWNTSGARSVSVNYSNAGACPAANPTVYPVTVNAIPIPAITGSTNVCEGSTGNVYSTAAGNTNYVWTVSAGGTVTSGGTTTDNTVTIAWNTAGAQSVTVNYSVPGGCTAAVPTVKNVTVNTIYTVSVSMAESQNNVCSGTPVTFTATPVNPGPSPTYQWYKNASPVGPNLPTYTFTPVNNDQVYVKLTSGYSCTTGSPANSNTVTMVVNPAQVPTITPGGSVCQNTTVTYTTEASMTNYSWNKSWGGTIMAGGLNTDNFITINWTGSGVQSVSVNYTAANGCSAASPTVLNVTVYALPVPPITGPGIICGVPNTGNVYTTTSGMTGYDWNVSAGGTITAGGDGFDNVTVTWNSAGSQTVSVTYTDNHSCNPTAPTVKNIGVYDVLPVSVSIAASANPVCSGSYVTFTATPVNGGTSPFYQWRVNGLNALWNSPTVWYTPADGDVITCVLTSNNPCPSGNPATSNAITMLVNPLPAPPTSGGDQVVCSTNLPANLSATAPAGCTVDWYNWSSGGSLLLANSSIYQTSTPGTYYAESRNLATGCKSLTRTAVQLTVNTAVKYYIDLDGDGYGNPEVYVYDCAQPAGYVTNGLDCDDNNPNINPSAQYLAYTGNPGFTNSIVSPTSGSASTLFRYEVDYFDATNSLPPAGYPRVMLDYEGNGSYLDPNDRVALMIAVDPMDLNTVDGKRYFAEINNLPYGANYTSKIVSGDGIGCTSTFGPFPTPDVLHQPNLYIFANDITFDPIGFHPLNSNLAIHVVVHNESDFDAQNFVCHLINQWNYAIVYPDITVANLPAHQNTTITWNIVTPAVPAWCPMQVIVDYTNAIAESNELDNSAVRPFTNGNYQVAGRIKVTANVSPETSYNYQYSSLYLFGHANYEDLAVPLPDPSVAGATVTATIVETNQVTSGYTNSYGDYGFYIPAPDPPGLYHVYVEVTDFTLTGDTTTHFHILEYTPPPPQPNLSLAYCHSVDVTPVNPHLAPGINPLGLEAHVTNNGNGTATGPIQVQFTYSSGGTWTEQYNGNLPAGQTVTITHSGAPLPPAGTTLTAYADPNNLVAELNESDNSSTDNMCYDFQTVGLCGGNFWGQYCMPSSGSLTIGLNVGLNVYHLYDADPVDVLFEAKAPGGAWTVVGTGTLNNATRNCYCPYAVTCPNPYTFNTVGLYYFRMTVDPNNSYPECNESNNVLEVTVNIVTCAPPIHKPNLSLAYCHSVDVVPINPHLQPNVTLLAHVVNNGDAPAVGTMANPIYVEFTYAGGLGTWLIPFTGTIAAGATQNFTVTTPRPPSGTLLTAYVDPASINNIDEWNESPNDNSSTDNMCYDFQIVAHCGTNFWSHSYLVGQSTQLSIGVNVYHLYDANPVKVKFEVMGPGSAVYTNLGNATMNNLTRNCGCPWVAVHPVPYTFFNAGIYHFRMTVDPEVPTGDYPECNENNNVMEVDVIVKDGADMRELSQFINPTPLNPDINQPISLIVTYENIGNSNVNDQMKLKVKWDNTTWSEVYPVPGLATGDHNSIAIPVPWTESIPGAHVIRAIIDADNQVIETNETNNEATRACIVGEAANLYFQLFAASNQHPDMGQFININTRIGNNGDVDATANIKFYYINDSGDTIPIGQSPVSVHHHDSVPLVMPWIVLDDQTTLIGKIMDVNTLEFNPDDNTAIDDIGGFDISFTSIAACQGQPNGSITASITGGAAPFFYQWNTGYIGETLTAGAGNYTVTVTDNTGLTQTKTGSIGSISSVPAAAGPISGVTPVLQGTTGVPYAVAPIANSTSMVWAYSGTGVTINGSGPAITLDFGFSATSGTLSVRGHNSCGDGAASFFDITVQAGVNPPAPFDVTGGGSYCQGEAGLPVGLSGSQAGVIYTLYKDGTAQTPTKAGTGSPITFGNQPAGTYTASGTNSSGTTNMNGSAVINMNPTLTLTATIVANPAEVCEGESVTITCTPNYPVSGCDWYINRVLAGHTLNLTYVPQYGDSVYCVCWVSQAQGNCWTSQYAMSNGLIIPVNPILTLTTTITTPQTTLCAGTPVTITCNPNYPVSSCDWYVNNVLVGHTMNLTYVPADGDIVYCVCWTTPGGCWSDPSAISNSISFTIAATLTLTTTISTPQTTVCAGTSVTITCNPNYPVSSCDWYVNGIIVGHAMNMTFVPLDGDSVYCVCWTTQGNCWTSQFAVSNGLEFTVNLLPAAAGPINGITPVIPGTTGVPYSIAPISNSTSLIWAYTGNNVTINGSGPAVTLDFGLSATSGQLSVRGHNNCGDGVASFFDIFVEVGSNLPVPFNVTGTGSYCQGSGGRIVGLSDSELGVTYQLFRDNLPTGLTLPGTGDPIDFGNQLSGTYTVSGNNAGGTTLMTGDAVITEIPVLPVSVSISADNNPVCAGTTVHFTATPVNGGASPAYNWFVNNVIQPDHGPAFQYQSDSFFDVFCELNSSYTCPTGNPATSNTIHATVNPLPAAVAGADRAICLNSNTTIGAPAVPGSTYSWTSVPPGFTSLLANPTVTPLVTTTYTVVETVTATGCNNSHSVVVTVNPLPAAAAGSNRAICINSSTTLGAAAVPGSTYNWTSVPPGFTSTLANPTVTPLVTTSYTVMETITQTGCSNSNSVIVTVNPLPVPTLNGPTPICNFYSGTYNTQTGMNNYQWTIPAGATIAGGGNPTSDFVTITWATAGTKILKVNYTNPGGCTGVSPAQLIVTVYPTPIPTITGTSTPCLNKPTVYSTVAFQTNYHWEVSGGATFTGQGTKSISVTWPTPGPQTVSLSYTGLYGCTAITPTVKNVTVVTSCTKSNDDGGDVSGIDPMDSGKESVTIYPNPNDGTFTATMYVSDPGTYNLQIFSNLGIKVYELRDVQLSGTISKKIDLRNVSTGVYNFILSNKDKSIQKRFIKVY